MIGLMAPDANWYPDPEGPGLRWWDGSAWTDHCKDAPAPPIEGTTAPSSADLPAASVAGPPTADAGQVEPKADPGPPPSSAPAWPPTPDEQTFDERAAAKPDQPAPPSPVTGADAPSQEMYRRMAADPGMWTRRMPDPAPAPVPPTRGAKVAIAIVLILVVGIIASIFHIGGSSNSNSGPAPTALETREEQYEAAHDAVCEHAPWKYEAECQ